VSVAPAPAINCPGGGAAITDAFLNTRYVCDGRTGLQGPQGSQGPQGPAGTTVVVAQTWINTSTFSAPNTGCCNTSWLHATNPLALPIPNSTFSGSTTGGRLLIQATLAFQAGAGPHLYCQPNIDGQWAGASMGATYYDYVYELVSSGGLVTVTMSRVYPAPPAGTHSFSLACGSNSSAYALIVGGVASLTVMELH